MQTASRPAIKPAQAMATRLAAVQAVYQLLTTDKDTVDIVPEFLAHYTPMPQDDNAEALLPPNADLFAQLCKGVEERKDQLAEIIAANLPESDPPKKLDDLLQATLLCGIYELLARQDVDGPIIIADYIAVTRAFYAGNEHKLVNAVLDKSFKTLRFA
jgi:N utilization substance protein B